VMCARAGAAKSSTPAADTAPTIAVRRATRASKGDRDEIGAMGMSTPVRVASVRDGWTRASHGAAVPGLVTRDGSVERLSYDSGFRPPPVAGEMPEPGSGSTGMFVEFFDLIIGSRPTLYS